MFKASSKAWNFNGDDYFGALAGRVAPAWRKCESEELPVKEDGINWKALILSLPTPENTKAGTIMWWDSKPHPPEIGQHPQ